jgi:hypothetical protein
VRLFEEIEQGVGDFGADTRRLDRGDHRLVAALVEFALLLAQRRLHRAADFERGFDRGSEACPAAERRARSRAVTSPM